MDTGAQRRAACCELVHEVAHTSGQVRFKVTGTSMLPALWPGDEVTVRRCDLSELQPGQIVVFHRQETLSAHRIMGISSDHLITQGDSLRAADPPVAFSDIVGRVAGVVRNGRPVGLERSVGQRAVSAILQRSDFCTHIALYLGCRLQLSGCGSYASPSPQPLRKSLDL